MLPQAGELQRAFDGLSVAKTPAFGQLVQAGRLRYGMTAEGACDLVDDCSSRLICESISARSSLLMVWPDGADRRAPLALAVGVVCDSVLRLKGDSSRGRILYVGQDASIREQFTSVRVGNTPPRWRVCTRVWAGRQPTAQSWTREFAARRDDDCVASGAAPNHQGVAAALDRSGLRARECPSVVVWAADRCQSAPCARHRVVGIALVTGGGCVANPRRVRVPMAQDHWREPRWVAR